MKYEPGNKGYNTDTTNFAPNVGIAWRPNVQEDPGLNMLHCRPPGPVPKPDGPQTSSRTW